MLRNFFRKLFQIKPPAQESDPEPALESAAIAERSAPADDQASNLRQAILGGAVDTARHIILSLASGSAALAATDKDGWTPLHCAVSVGNVELTELLLAKGASPAAVDKTNGWTPLHYAAAHNVPGVVGPLIAKGANPNVLSAKEANSPMHVASGSNAAQALQALIAHGAVVTTTNGDGMTALHLATKAKSVACVDALVDGGLDPDIRGAQNSTAMHWAANLGATDVARRLIQQGASADLVDDLGWSPVFLAANNQHGELCELLINEGVEYEREIGGKVVKLPRPGPDELLLQAAEDGDLAAVKLALEQGASVNCLTPDGWTPLLLAVEHPAVVQYLIQQGAGLNLASDRGYTPLMRAGGKGQAEVVRMLLAAGADPTATDLDGKSAFRLSSESSELDTTELICDAHAQTLVTGGRCADGHVLVPLDHASVVMIGMTRQTVGGTVRRVDLKFDDDTSLSQVKLVDEVVMEIPTEHASKHISSVSVPFEQS